jgi:hypothetical protein
MDKTITFDCQTKMVNPCCEDCIIRKACTLHEAVEKETHSMQPEILCIIPTHNKSALQTPLIV